MSCLAWIFAFLGGGGGVSISLKVIFCDFC